MDALSASTSSFKTDLQHLASTHSNTFSSIFQSNKENRASIQDLSSQYSNLSRLVGRLEGDLGTLASRQMLGVSTLDHANSLAAKHQLWISHADGLMGDAEANRKSLQRQVDQLSAGARNFVGRAELDATLGNFVGSNKAQWKGVAEAFEGRMGDMERMQTTIAKEVAELEEVKRKLAVVSEGLGKTQADFSKDISLIGVKADRNGAAISDLAELNISDKGGVGEEAVAALKDEIAALEDSVKTLGEDIEGDRERSRAGQKTIGSAMVQMKESVEDVKNLLKQRGQEIEGIVKEVKGIKDNEKKWMLGLGAVEKLGKLEKKLEVEKRGGDLALKKVGEQLDKLSMTVNKMGGGMEREETERKEGLEEVGLDLGVLKLKLGDLEGGVGGQGGRIRILEEEVRGLKKAGVGGGKKAGMTVDDKLSALQARAGGKVSSPGRRVEEMVAAGDDVNDSFESDADEMVHKANVEREREGAGVGLGAGVGAGPGLKSVVPVRKPKVESEVAVAVDEEEVVTSEDEEEEEEEEEFETFCATNPVPGPISVNTCDIVEDIVFHRKSSIVGVAGGAAASSVSSVPRVGDRVKARWKGLRSWFKGVCIAVNDRNAEGGGGVMTWNVQYDDGAIDKFVKKDFVVLDGDYYEGKGKGKGKGGGGGGAGAGAGVGAGGGKGGEKEELEGSTKIMFPAHALVMKWDAAHVRSWITNVVKLGDVAEKFHEKLMNGQMLLDKAWTPRDMEKNLSDPKEGMGIGNAQKRARVSAFIKALRETDIENRRARIRNYFNIWKDMDEVGDEEEETNF
ncbi:hypothetical protein TrRE_jg11068 [Triparma retinervis]|uniref:Uncharacterized protein n=1 Tax=Triparma retinervis TaxID=2557542 RepID=A0A9W7E913_9STRA|nr:hypothetical protein TrRE_jg11068 [Triparma retinervis]